MFKYFLVVGVTNQRETTILWDKKSGKPLYNALGNHITINAFIILFSINFSVQVWLDTRTSSTVDELLLKCPNQNKDYLKVNILSFN